MRLFQLSIICLSFFITSVVQGESLSLACSFEGNSENFAFAADLDDRETIYQTKFENLTELRDQIDKLRNTERQTETFDIFREIDVIFADADPSLTEGLVSFVNPPEFLDDYGIDTVEDYYVAIAALNQKTSLNEFNPDEFLFAGKIGDEVWVFISLNKNNAEQNVVLLTDEEDIKYFGKCEFIAGSGDLTKSAQFVFDMHSSDSKSSKSNESKKVVDKSVPKASAVPLPNAVALHCEYKVPNGEFDFLFEIDEYSLEQSENLDELSSIYQEWAEKGSLALFEPNRIVNPANASGDLMLVMKNYNQNISNYLWQNHLENIDISQHSALIAYAEGKRFNTYILLKTNPFTTTQGNEDSLILVSDFRYSDGEYGESFGLLQSTGKKFNGKCMGMYDSESYSELKAQITQKAKITTAKNSSHCIDEETQEISLEPFLAPLNLRAFYVAAASEGGKIDEVRSGIRTRIEILPGKRMSIEMRGRAMGENINKSYMCNMR